MSNFDDLNDWSDDILKGEKPPPGFTPVPGSKVGLWRKRSGDGYDYWKPGSGNRPNAHAWSETKLTEKPRQVANTALREAGFDGNGRFKSPGQALAAAWATLSKQGIEAGDVVSIYDKEKGRITVDIAMTNPKESMDPIKVTNSVLSFQYQRLAEDRYEVIAYLS